MAAGTLARSISRPSSAIWPVMLRPHERPNRLMANSVRPAPIKPAIPTTSPRRTWKSTLLIACRSKWSGVIHGPVLDLQNGFADAGMALRKTVREVAIDHATDDAVFF